MMEGHLACHDLLAQQKMIVVVVTVERVLPR